MTTINEYLLAKPNWINPLLYRRRWQTTILPSIIGAEQRSALFTWPRRTLSYSVLAGDFTESARIIRKLFKSLHLIWGIPHWQDRTTLTAQALIGQKVLQVRSTENRNYEEGGTCLLIDPSDLDSNESGTIDTFDATSITLEDDLGATWPERTEVYPVLKARIKSGQILNGIASRMGQLVIEAFEEFDDGITWHVGTSPYPDYLGYPVLNRIPNSEGKELRFIHPYESLAYIGKTYSASDYEKTLLRLSMKHVANSKVEIQKILDHFDSQKGRWGSFWLPTWRDDLRITAPFTADAMQITIESVDFASYWLNTEVGAYITILWPDGDRVCKRVLAAPTPITITLDSAIGKACSGDERRRLFCSFLLFCRFDHDEIEMKYHTDCVGEADLSFQTLLDEAPGGLS